MGTRIVQPGDTIDLRYALRLSDGTEILSNFDDAEADTITLGDGTLSSNLEQWLMGLTEGERHVFLLEPEQAFGVSTPDKIHHLPRARIASDMPLHVDTLVEFTLDDGQTLTGRILDIAAEHVEVDFNHPLAGLALQFEVEITQFHNPKSGKDQSA